MSTPQASPPRPLKKGMAVTSLVIGLLSIPTFGLLLVGAIAGVTLGIVGLVNANKQPEVYGGRGAAIAGIVTSALSLVAIPFIGIIAAIAIPSLLRARVSANESMAIGDIRTILSAEAAYQAANGGFYGQPTCLAHPSTCIPNYQGPTFIDPALTADTKSGYRRRFHPGATAASTGQLPEAVSPSSLVGYAFTAVPMNVGQTGVRSFCGDASGIICFSQRGAELQVQNGTCPVGLGCDPIQ